MKRSSDQLRNYSRPSRAGNEIVLQIKKKPRSETLEEFQSRLFGQAHETIDEFKSRLSAKNTGESNRTRGINKNYSTVAKGNQNKGVWPKDEGNVSNASSKKLEETIASLMDESGTATVFLKVARMAAARGVFVPPAILSDHGKDVGSGLSEGVPSRDHDGLPNEARNRQGMSADDRASFKAASNAHPWTLETGVAPSTHIIKYFEPWFERGLTIEDIQDAQPDMVAEYKKEIVRNTRKRIRALTKPHKLPAHAPRALRPSERPVAELSPDELARRRLVERRKKARLRDKKQQLG